jgi:Zn-finger nucleic acid-binding protein
MASRNMNPICRGLFLDRGEDVSHYVYRRKVKGEAREYRYRSDLWLPRRIARKLKAKIHGNNRD